MSTITRRSFCKTASTLACGFVGLERFCQAAAPAPRMPTSPGYGPLLQDPQRIFDLPTGFSYEIISRAGQTMDDGLFVPAAPDGMAAFSGKDEDVVLIMNHELGKEHEAHSGAFGKKNQLLTDSIRAQLYDPGHHLPMLGGTSTVVYRPSQKKVIRHFLSLAGTERNCAGGPSPWNTWITCEETDDLTAGKQWKQDHGYAFEVSATATGLAKPLPLKAMGRFRREAVAVDPKTSIVYQTEDIDDGLIYRFLPKVPGDLAQGGKLQALVITGQSARDTRNWKENKVPLLPSKTRMNVSWVDMEDVESPKNNLRYQGTRQGAAIFARGEGIWFGDGEVYWACTNGGAKQIGQIFRYWPSPYEGTTKEKEHPAQMELFLESTDDTLLANADNLTIAEWGDVFIAEDLVGPFKRGAKLVGITPEGACYDFGKNSYTKSELAGACFSPDHSIMFVNIQSSGLTLAITGPWEKRQG